MKLDVKELLGVLVAMGKVVPCRSPKAIFKGVRFVSDGATVRMEATSGDMAVNCRLRMAKDIAAPLDVVIDHGRCLSVVQGASCDTMSLEALPEQRGIKLSDGRSTAELPTIDQATTWPKHDFWIPAPDGAAYLLATDLADCCRKVACAANDLSTSYAKAVYISTQNGQMYFSGRGDRLFGLSWCSVSGGCSAIVPAKSLAAACAFLRHNDTSVECFADVDQFSIRSASFSFIASQASGRPLGDVNEMLNCLRQGDCWTVNRRQWLDYLSRVEPFLGDENTCITHTPTKRGVLCRFEDDPQTSLRHGTFESIVDGLAVGESRKLSRDAILSIVKSTSGEQITVWSRPQGVGVESDGYIGGVGCRA